MPNEINNNTLYRFRTIDKLLGDKYQELENQSIYFSPPESLNDPVEGLRDIYFQGDIVLWRNLFRHYLVCLVSFTLDYLYFGEDESAKEYFEQLANEDDVPDDLKGVWENILNSFFNDSNIINLIENIVKYRKKVSQVELGCYLSIIHPVALEFILAQFKRAGIIDLKSLGDVRTEKIKFLSEKYFDELNKSMRAFGDKAVDEHFIRHINFVKQHSLTLEHAQGALGANTKMLYNGFPFWYVQRIEKLMYPEWFTACFMSSATNSSVWGNYGHNHSGVCLIYRADFDNATGHNLKLSNAIVGYGMNGEIKGEQSFKFYEIRYTHQHAPLNFFESLGRLPIPTFNRQWLVDKDGNQSEYAVSFNDEWRNEYWDNFYVAITKKTNDWRYENEHRLIINNMSCNYQSSGVVLNYDFKSLKGIIFGINTADKDKLEIMNIVKRKMHENNFFDFKFYQAYYCRHSGEIKNVELNYLFDISPTVDV